jgi:hypothetical protein
VRKNLALVALMLGVGGAGGYLLAPRETQAPAPRAGGVAPTWRGAPAARGLTEADVQRVIREELAARPRGAEGAAGEARPGGDDEPAPILSPAAADALQATHERISRALVTKEWTQGDAAALTAALELLPPAQRDELLHTLVPALNRGEIRLAYHGPIFE